MAGLTRCGVLIPVESQGVHFRQVVPADTAFLLYYYYVPAIVHSRAGSPVHIIWLQSTMLWNLLYCWHIFRSLFTCVPTSWVQSACSFSDHPLLGFGVKLRKSWCPWRPINYLHDRAQVAKGEGVSDDGQHVDMWKSPHMGSVRLEASIPSPRTRNTPPTFSGQMLSELFPWGSPSKPMKFQSCMTMKWLENLVSSAVISVTQTAQLLNC